MEAQSSTISLAHFSKIDLRVGRVEEATVVPESQKLIKLVMDFGDPPAGGRRTIFVGMRTWLNPEDFIGKNFIFVYNLESKKMPGGEESQGMMLAVDCEGNPKPLLAPGGSEAGGKIK